VAGTLAHPFQSEQPDRNTAARASVQGGGIRTLKSLAGVEGVAGEVAVAEEVAGLQGSFQTPLAQTAHTQSYLI